MKTEDRILVKILTILGLIFGVFVGALFIAKAPGPFKISGAAIAIICIWGSIKVMRAISKNRKQNKKQQ